MAKRDAEFQTLFSNAVDAGILASNDFLHSHPGYRGPCGFAWVDVKPANSGFAKWLVANGHARKGAYGGVTIWIGKFLSTQCIDTKEKFAYAMASVLFAAGIRASADSRMD